MNPLEKLLKELEGIDGQLEALVANDELTADQRTEYDQLMAKRTAKVETIGRVREQQARSAERARLATDLEASQADERSRQVALERDRRRVPATPRRITDPDAPTASAPAGARTDNQGRVTGYFEPTDETINLRFGDGRDAQQRQSYRQQQRQHAQFLRSSGYVPWGEFESVSDFVRDGFARNGHPAFNDRVHRHYAAVQGMSEGVGSDGGYTVMPEFAAGIMDRVYANDLWNRTDNYTVSGNNMTFLANAETSRATGSRHGGLRGYWLTEGGAVTASKPTLREVSLKLCKLGVIVYLTQELMDDSGFALESYIARKAAEEFNFLIGDALINGTGAGQPLGILGFPSLVSVAKEGGQTAATLQTENITKMFARFFAPNFGNSIWLYNQDILPQLLTLTLGIGSAGVTTYMPPGGLSGTPYGTLLGRPMVPTEFNATLGTQGDLILADMGQILSISKGGVAQAVSMHVQFLTDQLALRFIMRLNAGPWENAPITPYKGSANTQSNFVTLDARS